MMNLKHLNIRQAKFADAQFIGLLSYQLGYSVPEEELQAYLISLSNTEEKIVYVACNSEKTIVGWINVYLSYGILTNKQAEIGGLIVDENYRGKGIGRLLIQEAQRWAQQQGCDFIQVRSQTKRQQAHAFYQNSGYKPHKTQLVLRKQLNIENNQE